MKRNINKIVIILLIITMILSLCACGNKKAEQELEQEKQNIRSGQQYELQYDSYNTSNIVTDMTNNMGWEPLGQSDIYKSSGIRTAFETNLKINKVTMNEGGQVVNSKQGCIYNVRMVNNNRIIFDVYNDNGQYVSTTKDGNNEPLEYREVTNSNSTLRDAFRNKTFSKYWKELNYGDKFGKEIAKTYKDLDKTSSYVANAALNAYFNILNNKNSSDYYNAELVLTRQQFYEIVYRAGFPVEDGINFNTVFNEYNYLPLENDSLNEVNLLQPITKLEAFYLLTKLYFPDYINMVIVNDGDTAFGFNNAGDMINEMGFGVIANEMNYRLLGYMSSHRTMGLDSDAFKTMLTAQRLGIGNGLNTNLFGVITKNEAINLLKNVYNTENNIRGYLTESEYAEIEKPVYQFSKPLEYQIKEMREDDFNKPLILTEDQVKFNGDAATFVDEDAVREVLAPVVEYMVPRPDFKLLLIGTTAGDGSSPYSMKLSQDRADAVKNLLIELGVNEDQLIAIGMGAEDPWHIPNVGTSGEQAKQNRKVVMLAADSEDAIHILETIEIN